MGKISQNIKINQENMTDFEVNGNYKKKIVSVFLDYFLTYIYSLLMLHKRSILLYIKINKYF